MTPGTCQKNMDSTYSSDLGIFWLHEWHMLGCHVVLISKNHNLGIYGAFGRSHKRNKHPQQCVLSTDIQAFFQSFDWNTSYSLRTVSAHVHTPFMAEVDSIRRGPAAAKSMRWSVPGKWGSYKTFQALRELQLPSYHGVPVCCCHWRLGAALWEEGT